MADYLSDVEVERIFLLAQHCAQENQSISLKGVDGTARQLAITAFFLAHEHHTSILNLLVENRLGSALALLRPCFEALARGLWLLRGASKEHVARFVDGQGTSVEVMLRALKKGGDAHGDGFLADTWELSKSSLHQYTHCSFQLLIRRFPVELSEKVITSGEIAGAIRFATGTAMLATLELARIDNNAKLGQIASQTLALLYPDV